MDDFAEDLQTLKARCAATQTQLEALPISEKGGKEWRRLKAEFHNLDATLSRTRTRVFGCSLRAEPVVGRSNAPDE